VRDGHPAQPLGSFPRISIVTPSLNQGAFIERTIRSMLLQQYPALEVIVMDGGSSDGTLAVIEHYAACIAHWESKPDRGQSDAINRGMAMATGEIVGWLNSDDYLLPKALERVAVAWQAGEPVQWVSGGCQFVDDHGQHMYDWFPEPRATLGEALSLSAGVPQPSSFWSKEVWDRVGGLDESLHYTMDEDLWMRFYVAGARPVVVPGCLAVRFVQRKSKTAMSLSRFSGDLATCILRHARAVPRVEKGLWRRGCRDTAERYAIQAFQQCRCRDFGGALEFLWSARRLSLRGTVRGLSRGVWVGLKSLVSGSVGRSASAGPG
jgi:glycosyltransferase involved in cell wall biosynthesis